MVFVSWGGNGPNPFLFAQIDFSLPLSMRLVFSIVRRAQHQVWLCADEMGTIGGLICGQPKSIALEVINDVRRAYRLIFGLGGRVLCLRGLCTGALLPVFLGGAAFFGPVA